MKKYVLLPLERYESLKRQKSNENHPTEPIGTNGLQTTGIPPGQFISNEPIRPMSLTEPEATGPEILLKASDEQSNKPDVRQSVQPFSNKQPTEQDIQIADTTSDANLETTVGKQPKKLQLKAKKQKKNEQKKPTATARSRAKASDREQNELSAIATAGRKKQFWLKP